MATQKLLFTRLLFKQAGPGFEAPIYSVTLAYDGTSVLAGCTSLLEMFSFYVY